jgi:hypothetical protein
MLCCWGLLLRLLLAWGMLLLLLRRGVQGSTDRGRRRCRPSGRMACRSCTCCALRGSRAYEPFCAATPLNKRKKPTSILRKRTVCHTLAVVSQDEARHWLEGATREWPALWGARGGLLPLLWVHMGTGSPVSTLEQQKKPPLGEMGAPQNVRDCCRKACRTRQIELPDQSNWQAPAALISSSV